MTQTHTHRVTEADAVRAAISGTRGQRIRIGAGALGQLLRDPDDTYQVFLLGLVANASAFPQFFLRFTTTADGQRLLAERPTIDGTVVERLRGLPADTLGGAYARYLDDNHLDADLFQAPPGLPEPIAYLAKRVRQTHDIWHVLTGYRPDVPGEVALQGFTYAQTRMPSAALIATFGTLRWVAKRPEMLRDTVDGFRRGKGAAFLASVYWEDHFERNVDDVRRDFGVLPARREKNLTARTRGAPGGRGRRRNGERRRGFEPPRRQERQDRRERNRTSDLPLISDSDL
jgi:ubiquinone biosynthesis protein COQ4